MKTKVILPLLFCFALNDAVAQSSDKIFGDKPSPSALFLLIPPDAVAGGLAWSGVAADDYSNAEFYNPAQTAFVKGKLGLTVGYTPWLRALVPDLNCANVSIKIKASERGTINLSYIHMSYGSIRTISIPDKLLPVERAFGLSKSYLINKSSSVGLKIKYIQSNILANSLDTLNFKLRNFNSLALGLSYYHSNQIELLEKSASLNFGVSLDNVGSKIGNDTLNLQAFIPTVLRVGQSIRMNLSGKHELSFQYDVYKLLIPSLPIYKEDANGIPTGEILSGEDPDKPLFTAMINSFSDAPGGFKEEINEIQFGGGFEYIYNKIWIARAGYAYESPMKGISHFYTVGGGLRYSSKQTYELAFAYLFPIEKRNPLENTISFSLRVH